MGVLRPLAQSVGAVVLDGRLRWARVRGWEADAAGAQAERALARVGLAERAAQRVNRLSAGEVQRVALARALASARGLLIVDEPTSRLDEASAHVVAELLGTAADDGQTVICATHDPVLVRGAEHVLELQRSRSESTDMASTRYQ